MFLAEALNRRKKLKASLGHLIQRYQASAVVTPHGLVERDPQALFVQYIKTLDEYYALIVEINKLNNSTMVQVQQESPMSMMEAIALREILITKHIATADVLKGVRRDFANALQYLQPGQPAPVLGIDLGTLQAASDRYAKYATELDAVIQRVNWTTIYS